MKIVLSGYYGFHNVGDEAILYAIIQALRAYEPNVDIVVLSNDPHFTARTYGVEAVNRWRVKDVVRALRASDGLISGGGSLLQDKTGWRTVPYYTAIIHIAKWLGKPVFVYAQGIGPLQHTQNQLLVKWTMNRVERITVRDEQSAELLRTIGVRQPIGLVPDPVMGLTVPSSPSAWWEQQSFAEPVIAVSVRDWAEGKGYERKIASALDRCAAEGATVVFIPMHGRHDDETSRAIASLMRAPATIAPYDASIEEKIAFIGRATMLVGMRLHALIFAAIANTPFLALSYDPKIDSFAKQAQQRVVAHVEDEAWDGEMLFKEIFSCLRRIEEERARLVRAVAPLRETAQRTAAEALAVFRRKS